MDLGSEGAKGSVFSDDCHRDRPPTSATGSHRSLPFSKILNSNIFVAPKEKYGDASSLLFLLLLLLSVPLSCLSIPMLLLVSTAGY